MSDSLVGLPVSRAKRRRLIFFAFVRVVVGLTLIWGAMYLLPDSTDGRVVAPVAFVLLCVAIYIAYFRHQLNRIKKAVYPTLQSAEALILVAAMFLAVYAAVYVVLSQQDPSAFTEPLTHFSAYYFALTVLATVGFGDITPVTNTARLIAMTQMAFDIAFVGVVVRILGGAAQTTIKQRWKADGKDAPEQAAGS
jgi:F0F1-type ATP synthase assembly protein I